MATERAWRREAERQAKDVRRQDGIADDASVTDEHLERMLADHGYPPPGSLPDGPRGMLVNRADPIDLIGTPETRRRWQRVNAGHLVGHAINHGGGRCGGCEDWS